MKKQRTPRSKSAPRSAAPSGKGKQKSGLNAREQAEQMPEPVDAPFRIPVFLSVAFPYHKLQQAFLDRLVAELKARLLFPRTLGVTDSVNDLAAGTIRRMINSSYGMVAVAFRRSRIRKAEVRPGSCRESVVRDMWVTSPYVQIEPSMAFQLGQPLLILRESGVAHDGVFGGLLEQGVLPSRILEFSVDDARAIDYFFQTMDWKMTYEDWITDVRREYRERTEPKRRG